MRIFLPFFLIFSVFAVGYVYHRPFRALLKKHTKKAIFPVLAVAVILLALFTAMSTSTWRLF